MRLSASQIKLLQTSAQHPGRPTSRNRNQLDGQVGRDVAQDPDEVKHILMDAGWTGSAPPEALAPLEDAAPLEAAEAASTGNWQPISTAPILRNVEVRTADILGPYALLYPCRYVPECGWINAILATPLKVQPVEWREWLRRFPILKD